MGHTSRQLFALACASAAMVGVRSIVPVRAQDQAPGRREFSIAARGYAFSPDRIEVVRDDMVKVTVQSADHAYSFTIDEYRVSRRVPPGGTTTFEFRADRQGTFAFYCSLSDPGCQNMRGTLVVRAK